MDLHRLKYLSCFSINKNWIEGFSHGNQVKRLKQSSSKSEREWIGHSGLPPFLFSRSHSPYYLRRCEKGQLAW